jgi:hypothetical protein
VDHGLDRTHGMEIAREGWEGAKGRKESEESVCSLSRALLILCSRD